MRMGRHGYQPAGGGGDGVLAVTSSSLSEIKVWLTHTPTYHWPPFPAVDQTQQAYINFKFNMNLLTSKVKDEMLGMFAGVLDKHDRNGMWLCCGCVYVCEDKSVFCKTEAICIQPQAYLMARQAMKQHTCGWKEVWGYILACQWNPWAFCNTPKKAMLQLLQKIHFVAMNVWMPHY